MLVAAFVCDVTASPTYTLEVIEIDLLPICVHVEPSAERYAVNVLPERVSRTHTGAVPLPPLTSVDEPPVDERY